MSTSITNIKVNREALYNCSLKEKTIQARIAAQEAKEHYLQVLAAILDFDWLFCLEELHKTGVIVYRAIVTAYGPEVFAALQADKLAEFANDLALLHDMTKEKIRSYTGIPFTDYEHEEPGYMDAIVDWIENVRKSQERE